MRYNGIERELCSIFMGQENSRAHKASQSVEWISDVQKTNAHVHLPFLNESLIKGYKLTKPTNLSGSLVY